MLKNIKIFFTTTVILLLFSVVCFAVSENNITYDYTSAASRAEYITNSNPQTYTTGTQLSLTDASCDGYEFAGWFSDADCKTAVAEIDKNTSGNITLYAKWYEMSYHISYVLTTPGVPVSAADVNNPNVHVRLASESVYLSDPSYIDSNYTFDGWYLDDSYTQKIDIIDEFTCNDITLYAKWVNTEYSIRYEMGDVSVSAYPVTNPNPDKYTFNTQVTLSPADTEDPSYTFEGWYTDESFTEKITDISTDTKGDITIYANWNKKEYKIKYVLDDGSGIKTATITNSNAQTRTADRDFVLSEPESSDKNYKFIGWYTSSDFKEESKITQIKAGVIDDITLYAKWEIAVYKISYNYGNIDTKLCPIVNTNPEQYSFGTTAVLTNAEAEGFIFNYWCTDASLKNQITEIIPENYGDITLYAYFTEKTYSITYITEDKNVTAAQVSNTSQTVRTTSEKVYFDDAKTISTEYKFGGWYYDKDFTQQATFVKPYTAENVVVYAKWIKIASYLPVWGDVTLSEELSAADARLLLRYTAGLETSFDEIQMRLADINNDSKINASDARLALRLSAGVDNEAEIIEKYSLPEIVLEEGELTFK